MSELSIRTYVAAFAADMSQADLDAHIERSLSPQCWADYLRRDVVLVALLDDRWIGYLQYGPTDRPGFMEIRRVYVDPEWQGHGIGSALVDQALVSRDLVAATSVEIDVWQANAGARRLYERFGFVPTDRRVPFLTATGDVAGYDIVLERRRQD